jgi:hypothetical protein
MDGHAGHVITVCGHAHKDHKEGFAVAVQVVAAIGSAKHRSFVIVLDTRHPWHRGQLQQLVRERIPDCDVEGDIRKRAAYHDLGQVSVCLKTGITIRTELDSTTHTNSPNERTHVNPATISIFCHY